jgi:hypothetical protein
LMIFIAEKTSSNVDVATGRSNARSMSRTKVPARCRPQCHAVLRSRLVELVFLYGVAPSLSLPSRNMDKTCLADC